jgi:hypothetical protein
MKRAIGREKARKAHWSRLLLEMTVENVFNGQNSRLL